MSNSPALRRKVTRFLIVGCLAAGVVALLGIATRENGEAKLERWTHARAIPTVDVIYPKSDSEDQQLVLPGNIEPWYSAPLHARVSGYVKMWYKDIGSAVRAGEVLADIDTPELDQRLEQAKGDLAKAQADADLAEITSKRWTALRKTNAVSQQVTDEKNGDYRARLAQLAASRANVARLDAFEGFKRLVAPFDGVITERKIDVGALVHNDSQSSSTELFVIADVRAMRIYVDVPQSYAAQIRPGMIATLRLSQYPARTFRATVATTSEAITRDNRSLLVELHRNNNDGLLQPGSFAEVTFQLGPEPNDLFLPASALIFRNDYPEVAVVAADGRVTLKRIQIGRDLGTLVEVSSGLSLTDGIVKNPSDSISSGDLVRISGQERATSEVSAR